MKAREIITLNSHVGNLAQIERELIEMGVREQNRADLQELGGDELLCVQSLLASSVLLKAAGEIRRIAEVNSVVT